ncbi:MAG: penicillin-binding transpeptidase domain-containing protein [Lachnospiraceae bacterium]|nr:penicillin-binding transpeptidase domain-containing protein [Lachnospiraceae bacterium]
MNMVTSRLIVLLLVILGMGGYLISVIFHLQIVKGEEYYNNFQLKITKKRTLPATRGNILDRNGNLLAYNELAYAVTIEDVYESGRRKNAMLNDTIRRLIAMIEENGDQVIHDFHIEMDKNGEYCYNVEGTQLLRFLADVYGYASIDDMKEKYKSATPDEVITYLCSTARYGIGDYTDDKDSDSFVEGLGFTKEEVLKILTIRYAMSANSYQRYIATTVAENVSPETVAVIMENEDSLDGVSIAEGTIRKYNESIYFAQIIGYTGRVDQEELKTLQEQNPDYDLNDTVGKSGIEASMEMELQGKKGSETVHVDNMGKVVETSDLVEPSAGNDITLTIDAELQKACYHILESKLASILLAKIQNIKEYTPPEGGSGGDIPIPIYDVYYACINNNVIDTSHFTSKYAGDTEMAVRAAYLDKKARVFATLEDELMTSYNPYNVLTEEYQVYESYFVSTLYDRNILMKDVVDKNDATYIAWTKDEEISLNEFLNYAIAQNWVNVAKLSIDSRYSDSVEIYHKILEYTFDVLDKDVDFDKKIYRYMILNDEITGRQICELLMEQHIVDPPEEEIARFRAGELTPYVFFRNRIEQLDLTPAQLAIDPYSGSIVVTDVNTGDVRAISSYPSYDNNRMANGVDAAYFASLRNDLSSPMLNYATQQRTAPGSTFKPISATAGLLEGVITTTDTITCVGLFDKVPIPPSCWNKNGHGSLNVTGGLRHSCNWFFYEVGYRLATVGDTYNDSVGLQKLAKYADMYGLSETSGIEIEEYAPGVSDLDAVRSAIGHGTNNYTTAGLARYVTTVANSGTCYNLTLVDKVEDQNGDLIRENAAAVRNRIDMDPAYWNAIHAGMRQVVENKSYFADLDVNVAGKTGTAQESRNRPNHALFISYAPYEDPEISVTVRVANGYTSDYAAQIAKDVYEYYYGLKDESEIITGTAGTLEGGAINAD